MDDITQLLSDYAVQKNTINALKARVAELERAGMALNIAFMLVLQHHNGQVEISNAEVVDMALHVAEFKIEVEPGELPYGLTYKLLRNSTRAN